MRKVTALRNYSDNYYIFREGMIYNLPDDVADIFINKGVMIEGAPDDIIITSNSTSGTEIADIKINGQSNKLYANTGEAGYSIQNETQWCIEEQTITLTNTNNSFWGGLLEGGYLPAAGNAINITINGETKECIVQQEGRFLIAYFIADEESETFILIAQNSQIGITDFRSSMPYPNNQVTISAYNNKQVITTTQNFQNAVKTVIQPGYSRQKVFFLQETSFTQTQTNFIPLQQFQLNPESNEEKITVIIDGIKYENLTPVLKYNVDMSQYLPTVPNSNSISGYFISNNFENPNFFIILAEDPWVLVTNFEEGTQHTISIYQQQINTTQDFQSVVKSVIDLGYNSQKIIYIPEQIVTQKSSNMMEISWQAFPSAGKTVTVILNGVKYENLVIRKNTENSQYYDYLTAEYIDGYNNFSISAWLTKNTETIYTVYFLKTGTTGSQYNVQMYGTDINTSNQFQTAVAKAIKNTPFVIPFLVQFTFDTDNTVWKSSVTFQDITTLLQSNQQGIPLILGRTTDTGTIFNFEGLQNNKYIFSCVTLTSSGSVMYNQFYISSSDNCDFESWTLLDGGGGGNVIT